MILPIRCALLVACLSAAAWAQKLPPEIDPCLPKVQKSQFPNFYERWACLETRPTLPKDRLIEDLATSNLSEASLELPASTLFSVLGDIQKSNPSLVGHPKRIDPLVSLNVYFAHIKGALSPKQIKLAMKLSVCGDGELSNDASEILVKSFRNNPTKWIDAAIDESENFAQQSKTFECFEKIEASYPKNPWLFELANHLLAEIDEAEAEQSLAKSILGADPKLKSRPGFEVFTGLAQRFQQTTAQSHSPSASPAPGK